MQLMTNEIAELFWLQFWQLTILIGVAGLLGRTVFRNRPHLMHVIWIVVIVKSLTVPLWGSPAGLFSRLQPRLAEEAIVEGHMTPVPPTGAGEVEEGKQTTQVLPPAGNMIAVDPVFVTMVAVWATGFILLLGFAISRWVWVYRTLKRRSHAGSQEVVDEVHRLSTQLNMKSHVRVIISDSNFGPMVFGLTRPVLILPAALAANKSPRQLRPFILHELLHVRRGDTLFGALQFVAQLIWWFHPLVWWACRQANRVGERCCDEEVVANLECNPRDYARCLLDVLELHAALSTAPALPGIRSADITSVRVEHIVANPVRFRKKTPRRYWIYAVGLALLLFPGGRIDAEAREESQDGSKVVNTYTLRARAERAAANRDWKEAASLLRTITETDKSDGRAWFMLGYCLHADGKLDEAIIAHKQAATFPRSRPTALYNLACAFALQSDRDAAIETLKLAIDSGFVSATSIADDVDFAFLKSDPDFLQLVSAAKPNADREIYRQFDFWVGRWDVINSDGQVVGVSTISKDEKGFLITEKLKSASGASSTSINYYDPGERRWKQTLIDADGNVVHFSGGFHGGTMSFVARTRSDRPVAPIRVSYSRNHDGSVRKLIQRSKINGNRWTTDFDGRYVPRVN